PGPTTRQAAPGSSSGTASTTEGWKAMPESPLVACASALTAYLKDDTTRSDYPLLASINVAGYGEAPGSDYPRLVLRILRQRTAPPVPSSNAQRAEGRLLASLELVATKWASAEKLAINTADELRRALNS